MVYLLVKDFRPMLNQENIRPPIIQCRRNLFIFFVMEVYIEKMMEQLNSGESKTIFGTILCILDIGLIISGRASWQEEEERFQYCTDSSGKTLYIRALQGHSGRNLIDPSIQDNSEALVVEVALCVYAGGAVSVWRERTDFDFFFGCLSFFCHRFLAGQFFLSGDVCWWAFVSRVPRSSMGLGSRIVCAIDEEVAEQSVLVMEFGGRWFGVEHASDL